MWVFNVCWNNYGKFQNNSMIDLLNNEKLSDCILVTEGKSIRVHRIILAIASPYFMEMFSSSIYDAKSDAMYLLNDISYVTLCQIVKFVYSGQIYVKVNDFTDFKQGLSKFGIEGSKELTTNFVKVINGLPQTISASTAIFESLSSSNHPQITITAMPNKRKRQAMKPKQPKSIQKLFNCRFCHKRFNARNTVKNHERFCQENPNRMLSLCNICQQEVKPGSMTFHKRKYHQYVPQSRSLNPMKENVPQSSSLNVAIDEPMKENIPQSPSADEVVDVSMKENDYEQMNER